jgi:general secretion pathway protein L
MLQADQKWDLFGYDVRSIGKHWTAAWREFLWGYDSPVKEQLDELVTVHGEDGSVCYHAGAKVESSEQAECEAVLLPDSMVLTRKLQVPLAAEADLDAVMTFEVSAHSPFPSSDTGFGWKLAGRSETSLQVQLAIVSLSNTMTYLGREYDCHDASRYEVWAEVNGSTVVLGGFGEGKRRARYRKRLLKVAAMVGYSALVLVLVFGLAAGSKYLEWRRLSAMSANIEARAADAAKMRSSLVGASETITGVREIIVAHPSPYRELARITHLLGDQASVQQFTMNGRSLRLRGEASNASEVMEKLAAEPAYDSVTAPQAITKLGKSDRERFVLNITLAEPAP